MALTLQEAKARIDQIMSSYADAQFAASNTSILSSNLTLGKAYEAWVLSLVLENLRIQEGYAVTLMNSTKVVLKSSPGPINPSFSHFRLDQPGRHPLEVWTDIEFLTLSHALKNMGGGPRVCDYHELDIVVVPGGTTGRPGYHDILLGVECKHTAFQKHMARSALGVRRELSFLTSPNSTAFDNWPCSHVPANPASVLLVYSTDRKVSAFNGAGEAFGVTFIWEEM